MGDINFNQSQRYDFILNPSTIMNRTRDWLYSLQRDKNTQPDLIYNMKHFREILRVSLPLVVSTASYTVLTFTDRMFLSWYSPEAIAASVPAMILSYAGICFFMGTGQYTNVLIAQFFGASLDKDVARSLWQGIYFSIISSLILLLFIPLGKYIIDISGHGIEVITLEKAYFEILLTGGGLVVLNGVLSSYYSGRGKTKIIMYISFVGAAINIFLNYILIFGRFGFPELGIEGAGIATVTSNFAIAIIYLAFIFLGKDRRFIPITKLVSFNWRIFYKLLRFGAPNGFQQLIDITSFTVFIFLIGLHGDHILAATNIVLSINMLAFMPMLGFGQAAAILVGQYIGKNEKESVLSITSDTLKVAFIYGIGIGLLFLFFPEFFIQFFKSADTVSFQKISDAAIPLFMILPAFLLSDTVAIIYGSVLGGTGDTKFKMWFSVLLSSFLFVPGEVLILKTFGFSAIIGWLWITFYLTLMAFVFWMRFKTGNWRKIDMIH